MTQLPHSVATNEPIAPRRKAALSSIDIQTDVMQQFAEKYRFNNKGKEACVDTALQYLNETFFRDCSRQVTSFHQMQVITVALETDLNPFNNELYGIWTPFGDLKVLATVDGWNRLATSLDLTLRDFTYSETMEKVQINGHEYSVPTWIECKVVSEDKGASHAREFFWEVYNNSANQTISWSRPARQLANVAFVQALRKMLRITALSDSDTIADIDRHYEAESMKKSQLKPEAKAATSSSDARAYKAKQQPKELNIDIDSIPVIDIENEPGHGVQEVSQPDTSSSAGDTTLAANEAEPEEAPATETSAPETTEQPISSSKEAAVAIEKHEAEHVDETTVPRAVLMMIKPIMAKVKNGVKPMEDLMAMRNVISDELALRWFDQEVEKLK